MTLPNQPVGAANWNGRKSPSDIVFPSMSTLAGNTLASPALENWAITATAERVVENMGTLSKLADDDPAAAIRRITELRYQRPDGTMTAAQRGTFLHEVFENWLHGVAAPAVPPGLEAQLQPSIDRLSEWFIANRPTMVASEQCVYNFAVPAAGRFDGVISFGAGEWAGRTVLVDLKTKGESTTARGYDHRPYGDSVCLQMAGYRWAEKYATFPPRTKENDRRKYGGRAYLLNETEIEALGECAELYGRGPEDLQTAVVLLTPDWCRTHEIETGPEVLDALKAVRAAWQWKYVDSEGMVHPAKEVD